MAVFCSLDVSDSLIFHGLQHTRLPSLVTQMVKEPPAMKVFDPRGRKIPWRRARQPTSVFLPGESHGQRSLAGYSPWGRKESDTTELVTHTQTHTQTHTHTHRHTHTHTHTHTQTHGFPGGASVKEPACQCRKHKRHGFDPWVGKIPWRREWQPSPGLFPGESHGQRNLAGYSL